MIRFLKKGDKVINVGTQSGIEALRFAQIIGDTGKLYLFESNPASFNLINKSVYLNGLENFTTVYHVAAGDSYYQTAERVHRDNTGGGRVIQTRRFVEGEMDKDGFVKVGVTVMPLDDILREVSGVNFIMLDTEGLEKDILIGMKRLIERSPGVVIWSEWSNQSRGVVSDGRVGTLDNIKALADWFEAKGYALYQGVGNGAEPQAC